MRWPSGECSYNQRLFKHPVERLFERNQLERVHFDKHVVENGQTPSHSVRRQRSKCLQETTRIACWPLGQLQQIHLHEQRASRKVLVYIQFHDDFDTKLDFNFNNQQIYRLIICVCFKRFEFCRFECELLFDSGKFAQSNRSWSHWFHSKTSGKLDRTSKEKFFAFFFLPSSE